MLGGYHAWAPAATPARRSARSCRWWWAAARSARSTIRSFRCSRPTARGIPIFANIAGFFPTRGGSAKEAGLPDLDGCTRVEASAARGHRAGGPSHRTQPDAGARRPAASTRGAPPSSAATRRASGSKGPRALDQESPFLRFWGQMVRWLAGRTTAGRGQGEHRRHDRQGLLRARGAGAHRRRRPRRKRRRDRHRQGRRQGQSACARPTKSR